MLWTQKSKTNPKIIVKKNSKLTYKTEEISNSL